MLILGGGIILFSAILIIILIISYLKGLKKSDKAALNILWLFLPIIGIIVLAMKLEPVKKFGKSKFYIIGLILLPIIFVPLLAFSDNINEEKNANSGNIENNTFDANNVINDSNYIYNGVDAQINPLDNNIPVDNTNAENEANQNNIVEPTVESVIAEPTVEENSVPEQNKADDTFNSAPVIHEINNEAAVPMMEESAIVEPIHNNETLTTFNYVQEMPKVNNSIEEPVINKPDQNIEPVNELNVIPEVNNTGDASKKVCKNCGNELPTIVSLCPNCGTENE